MTVVVLDNAPIYKSKAFLKKVAEWSKKKLKIFWLPTYSPQLNLIETWWRFMKYKWIESQAYPSSVTFRDRSLRRENYSDFSDLVFIIRKKSTNSFLNKGSRIFK